MLKWKQTDTEVCDVQRMLVGICSQAKIDTVGLGYNTDF